MTVKPLPPAPVGRPPRMIGALLRIPFQETVRRIHEDLVRAGFGDLRPAHFVVFQLIDPGGARQTELAERAQITKQSMGYLVDYLAGAGYVERVPDPRDGRASLVRLTALGDAVERAARASLERLEGEWAALLGPARYAALKRALTELSDTIGQV